MYLTDRFKSKIPPNWIGVVAVLFALTILIAIFFEIREAAPILNSGDYGRTLRGSGRLPIMQPLDWGCFNTNYCKISYHTTMATWYTFNLYLNKILGYKCFGLEWMFFANCIFYGLGSILSIYRSPNRLISISLILFPVFLYGDYLGSFYEESALLILLPWVLYSLRVNERYFLGWIFYVMIAAIFLYSKAQNVYFLPLLFFGYWVSRYKTCNSLQIFKAIVVGAVLLVFSYLTITNHPQNKIPNSYNRTFNGQGWSMMGVGGWPVNDFVGRLKYYQDNETKLQSYIDEKEVGDGYGLWGTSYWPDGVGIISKLRNQSDHEKLEKIEKLISVNEYFLNYKKPEILLSSIIGLTQVFWLSNYSLSYLIPRDVELENIRYFIKLHMSKVYLTLCILIIFFLRTLGAPVFLYMLSAPMFVFVGDGYYEFEKHMVVIFISLPLFVGIFLYSRFFQIGSGR